MNRENLQRMADYIRTIPQKKFGMKEYRTGSRKKPKCGSVGCVIGHCTVLHDGPFPMIENGMYEGINFFGWSQEFTGIHGNDPCWDWCFSDHWSKTDNTPEGAALRIEWLLNYGLPDNWFSQMVGSQPLCYLPQTAN